MTKHFKNDGRLLFLAPARNEAERVLEKIGRTALQAAQPPVQLELTDLSGSISAISRTRVDEEIQRDPVPHLLYFGHGAEDRLGLDQALVDSANIASLRARVVLAVACSSARRLASIAVREGVRAYLGFSRPVFVPAAGGTWSLDPWTTAARQLVNGSTTGQAASDMKKALCEEGDRILANAVPTYKAAAYDANLHYGASLVFDCIGDEDATLFEGPRDTEPDEDRVPDEVDDYPAPATRKIGTAGSA